MMAFSYLNPYLEKIFKPYERYQRMIVMLTLIYHCFIIIMLHQVSLFPSLCKTNLHEIEWRNEF